MSESIIPVGFSAKEMSERLERVRSAMAVEQVDALIVLAPDSQYWLSGLESFISGVLPQALIVPGNRNKPPSLVMWDADVPLGKATANIEHIESYRFGVDDPVRSFRLALDASVPDAKIVGFDAGSRAVPYTLGTALVEALSPANCIDCSAILADARLVKSDAELAILRRAGTFANAGLSAAIAHAHPGTTERQLAAEIEYAMRFAGSDYPSIPTELASGSRSVLVHGTPSHRILQAGDFVHVEVGGVEQRYNAVGLQTIQIGGGNSSQFGARLYDVARACLSAGLGAIRPGIVARDVEAPALAVLGEAGLGDAFQMRFGYGVGAGYPPTWLDPFQITRTSTQTLEPGIAFVLHACLLDESNDVGVVVGGTFAVTNTGIESIAGAGPVELHVT